MLLRIEAARARLSGHHSAHGRGMQRRGGGGGGGGAFNRADAQAARRLLLSIFDGAVEVRGRGPGRDGAGKGNGKGGGRAAFAARVREGEWPCVCGFPSNRPYREACHACHRPRASAEVTGAPAGKGSGSRGATSGKGYKGERTSMFGEGARWGGGPVGADGARPLLGGRSHRPLGGTAGKGSDGGSAGAKGGEGKGLSWPTPSGKAAATSMGKASGGVCNLGKGRSGVGVHDGGGHGKGKGGNAWAKPSPVVDSEGYELVQPRRVRVAGNGDQGGGAGGGTGPTCARETTTAPTTARRLWSDDASDDGDVADEEADGDEGGGEGEGDAMWQADPRQLRAEFEDLARAARDMERRGTRGSALDTLRQARDDAERRWREAKPPAPLPKRLEWAEAKLHKAQASLSRERIELDRMDEEYDARRAEQCRRIEEAEGWYKWRKHQLEQVHQEAAELAPGGRDREPAEGGAGQVSRRIRGHVLPEMQAILEELQEGTPLRERMALLVAGLADAESQLGGHAGQGATAHYDMYDGDSQEDGLGGHHQEGEDGDDSDQMGDGYEYGGGAGRSTTWRPEGPGRWSKARTTEARTGTNEAPPGQAHNHTQRDDSRGSGGGAAAATDDGDKTSGTDAAQRNDGDGETGERAGKHRRRDTGAESNEGARREDDARRAQELRKQIEEATAAQTRSFHEGRGGFGSEAALSAAAQRFVMDVQRAQAQAHEMGVEPLASDGRSLLELTPAELRQWVEEHRESESMQD